MSDKEVWHILLGRSITIRLVHSTGCTEGVSLALVSATGVNSHMSELPDTKLEVSVIPQNPSELR